mmetsp:Transcript_22938/g.43841  ORF Transcript_22938/g.43841 Transcript_22938/m.43841 type:complete len:234 (-) Transcript_22938:776-1477(-)
MGWRESALRPATAILIYSVEHTGDDVADAQADEQPAGGPAQRHAGQPAGVDTVCPALGSQHHAARVRGPARARRAGRRRRAGACPRRTPPPGAEAHGRARARRPLLRPQRELESHGVWRRVHGALGGDCGGAPDAASALRSARARRRVLRVHPGRQPGAPLGGVARGRGGALPGGQPSAAVHGEPRALGPGWLPHAAGDPPRDARDARAQARAGGGGAHGTPRGRAPAAQPER